MAEDQETARKAAVPGVSEKCPNESKIGLALSGGGVRASAFHMGALRYLATNDLIKNVTFLSTVSGGSLVTGLLISKSRGTWPADLQSFEKAAAEVKAVLTTKNLQRSALLRMLNPWNWRHIFSRANVVADSLENLWGIKGTLGDLPASPIWELNGTTMETGRRWRFVSGPATRMGDGSTGDWPGKDFPLAKAMAASAAFPGGVTPLQVHADPKTATLKYPDRMNKSVLDSGKTNWHIADGGVYDNLGLEPVFDASSREIRKTCGCDFVIVSDAGSPLRFSGWSLWAQGLGFGGRTIDIMYAQGRNTRTRSFVGAVRARTASGIFLNIASSRTSSIDAYLKDKGTPSVAAALTPALEQPDVDKAAAFPTTLNSLTSAQYELLELHGFETAQTQWQLYGIQQFKAGCPGQPTKP
jgi:NTE family protein